MAAQFELCIALGFEIELCNGRLQRQIEQLRGLRAHVLEREWLKEAADVRVHARPLPIKAREFEAGAEGTEALREIGRLDREEIVAQSVVSFPQIAHPPVVL